MAQARSCSILVQDVQKAGLRLKLYNIALRLYFLFLLCYYCHCTSLAILPVGLCGSEHWYNIQCTKGNKLLQVYERAS